MFSPVKHLTVTALSLFVCACGAQEEVRPPQDGGAEEAAGVVAPSTEAEAADARSPAEAEPAPAAAEAVEAPASAVPPAPRAPDPMPDPTPEQAAPTPASAEPAGPPAAFASCRTCHSVDAGAPHRIGPNLFGVINAPAGRHADFNYSNAMAEADFTWTEERLDAFLQAPRDVVPGNRMMAPPVRDAAARREIVAYLASLK